MGGGLIQLVLQGIQDNYIIGNPDFTYFKSVFRKHTNFSIEVIKQTLNGTNSITSKESKGFFTVSRNGDLLSNMYLSCTQNNTNGIIGDRLLKQIEMSIGGTRIDKYTGEWAQIWNELSIPNSKKDAIQYQMNSYNDLRRNNINITTAQNTNNSNNLVNFNAHTNVISSSNSQNIQNIIVPLEFWFCKNIGSAIPLIALQYHEIIIDFVLNSSSNIGNATPNIEFWGEYIFLDKDERKRFSQSAHEYIIEQLQYKTVNRSDNKFFLDFNHPVKEVIWTTRNIRSYSLDTTNNIINNTVVDRCILDASEYNNRYSATTGITNVPFTNQTINININGQKRFSPQYKEFFQVYQPSKYHTSVPGRNIKRKNNFKPITLISKNINFSSVLADSFNGANYSTNVTSGQAIEGPACIFTQAATVNNIAQILILGGTQATTTTNPFDKLNLHNNFLFNGDIIKFISSGLNTTDANNIQSFVGEIKGISFSMANDNNPTNNGAGNYSWIIDIRLLIISGSSKDSADEGTQNNVFLNMELIDRNYNIPQPRCTSGAMGIETNQLIDEINVYSFALKPEEYQPSGTCNFSRADSVQIVSSSPLTIGTIYVRNYNILRIASGMGGLAFAN